MIGQRFYIQLVCWLSVSTLTLSYAWAGVDPVQFFTQERPQLVRSLEQGTGAEPGDQKYLARDKYGNSLQVRFGEPLSMYGEVGGSLLAQGLELPLLPTYPAFLQQSPNGERLRATVQPLLSSSVALQSAERLTPVQTGEWLGQLVFNHVLGNAEVLTKSNPVVLSGNHVVTQGLEQIFRSYESPKKDSLADYLNLIPSSRLQSLSEAEASEVLLQLNRYLSRLEKLSPSDISNLFGGYFESAENSRRAKKLVLMDYAAEFRKRVQTVRAEASAYFKKNYPQFPVKQNLDQAVHVGHPAFHMPVFEKNSTAAKVSKAPKKTPEDQLWKTYFQNSTKYLPEEDRKISELLEQAKRRESIYYVGPTINPKYFDTEMEDPPQTHLNPKT